MVKAKTIYLVRHGQSVDNVSPVFQSETAQLSEDGLRQADFMANRVSHLQFEALISSPLKRTKQTATAIAKATGHGIEFSDLFVERMKPKSISGKPHTDKAAVKLWNQWEKSFYIDDEGIDGAENYSRILNRADRALKYLLDRDEETLLVVTHGYFLRVLVTRVMLADKVDTEVFKTVMKSMNMENTGITIIKYADAFQEDYRWRLWIHNDHAHLAE